jgi:hypothetical protein
MAHSAHGEAGIGMTTINMQHLMSASMRPPAVLEKSNPYHDPHTGEFTSAGGAGASAGSHNLSAVSQEIDDLKKAGVKTGITAEQWGQYVPNGVSPKELVHAMTGSDGQKGLVMEFTPVANKLYIHADKKFPGALNMFGAQVLGYERAFDWKGQDVEHGVLTLMPGSQDGGAIKSMLRSAVPLYEKLGMKTISLYANLDAGGYAWARYGFQPQAHDGEKAISGTLDYAKQLVNENKGQLSTDAMAEYTEWRVASKACMGKDDAMGHFTDLKTPTLDKELSSVLHAEVPQLKNPTLTKVSMQNQSWSGVLKLNDAWSRMRFDRYVGL